VCSEFQFLLLEIKLKIDMVKKLLLMLFIVMLGSCSLKGTYIRGSFSSEVDSFTNNEVVKTAWVCSWDWSYYCFRFVSITNVGAHLEIKYEGSSWLFFDDVRMKVLGEDVFIDIEPFRNNWEVLSGGSVLEKNYYHLSLDDNLFDFIRSSAGKVLLVRLYGKGGYTEFELDTSKGDVWGDFIKYYEELISN